MRRRFGTWYIYGVVVYIYEKREGYIGNVQVRCTGNIYIQLCIYIYIEDFSYMSYMIRVLRLLNKKTCTDHVRINDIICMVLYMLFMVYMQQVMYI